ncbi:MAG: peptidase [Gemmatimonadota bacterium]|nr:MAG: peptidase [Gemmatimonadota bacterium]
MLPGTGLAQVTRPIDHFGFNIGDDYHLATYTQVESYWRKLADESPRMVLQEIGQTAEARAQLMCIITSPENHRDLARYRDTARRLALAEGLTDDEARRLAREGKAVVWLDGGLHATEVVGAHQIVETVYQLVSLDDAETMRFLDDVIILAVHANPDGMELVSNWYMRHDNPEDRSTSGLPRLYHWYVGHDNNRDAYMNNMPETENMSRVLYREWFPQIVYNHHQSGPAGTVLFAPPFRDPFNHDIDPLVITTIDGVGSAMHRRFIAEGKPGATMRSGASYSTWWNGGQRTTPYWHNMVGLLTEIIGHPTPMQIPLIPDRQLAHNDMPYPIAPQEWHFRQSIDYSVTANRAVLDYASRNRENLLYNIYLMGKNSIERGSQDHWTIRPKRIEALRAAAAGREVDVGRGRRGIPSELYDEVLHDPAHRDPRGFILPSDRADFPAAAKFVNALIKSGVTVHRATADFAIDGKTYPAGSFVVMAAQAFRPHVISMFEPQDHPNDFAYPGGPPIAPYDVTGWTLAFQMGVEFDRILDGFSGPFEKIEGFAEVPAGTVTNAQGARGFLLSHEPNVAFVAMTRLLTDGERVYWLTQPVTANGNEYPAGTMYIRSGSGTAAKLQQLASELGISFEGVSSLPRTEALQMQQVRVGLWDQYGGSMPSGWTRWLLEQFEFPFEVVYPPTLDAGRLKRQYDVLIFPTGAISAVTGGQQVRGRYEEEDRPSQDIPEEYRSRVGRVTADVTVPQLRAFLEDGGTIITIGTSANLATHLDLPIGNHLVDENGRPLRMEDYFIPGSLLEARVDNTRPIAYGMGDRAMVTFRRSPVFRLEDGAEAQGVRRVAWYDSDTPLRSGWAWGQEHVQRGLAAIEADVGEGKLYIFGPEVLFRGQPHGTFKFVFNGIYLATARSANVN